MTRDARDPIPSPSQSSEPAFSGHVTTLLSLLDQLEKLRGQRRKLHPPLVTVQAVIVVQWYGLQPESRETRVRTLPQGCGSATRFQVRDCSTKKKINKNLLSPGHVATRRSRRYKTLPNTDFVFCRLHEM